MRIQRTKIDRKKQNEKKESVCMCVWLKETDRAKIVRFNFIRFKWLLHSVCTFPLCLCFSIVCCLENIYDFPTFAMLQSLIRMFETQIATTFGCQMKRAVSTIVSNLYPESIWCLTFDNLHTKKINREI